MLFVLHGGVVLNTLEHKEAKLLAGDSVVVPAGLAHGLSNCTSDLELLDVTLPSAEGAGVCVQRHPLERMSKM